MSLARKGIRLRFSPARRLVDEYLFHARQIPTVPVRAEFNVTQLVAARMRCEDRPSWVCIFIKAFSIVAQQRPELRRCYQRWPTKHLYEHPGSECTVLVEREWDGEKSVLAAKVHEPESMPITEIQKRLRRMQNAALTELSDFRQLLNLSRMPGWMRRAAFWFTMHLSGERRCRRLGTFMVSTLGDLGAELLHPRAAITTYLSFGPVRANGDVAVILTFDHRVLDGRTAARALTALRETLNGVICAEIRMLPRRQTA